MVTLDIEISSPLSVGTECGTLDCHQPATWTVWYEDAAAVQCHEHFARHLQEAVENWPGPWAFELRASSGHEKEKT